ncbi:MAG: hypothetical protein JW958_07390 [Candidatus Eisenbacteria bacterium]|nr:hypothetical protein [Candidatus Eisenbacteria bacterium]
MEDLSFGPLDEQIAHVRHVFTRMEEQRRQWERDRLEYEGRLRALEEELESLRAEGENLGALRSENELYRKSRDEAREQVRRMLERIRSFDE